MPDKIGSFSSGANHPQDIVKVSSNDQGLCFIEPLAISSFFIVSYNRKFTSTISSTIIDKHPKKTVKLSQAVCKQANLCSLAVCGLPVSAVNFNVIYRKCCSEIKCHYVRDKFCCLKRSFLRLYFVFIQ